MLTYIGQCQCGARSAGFLTWRPAELWLLDHLRIAHSARRQAELYDALHERRAFVATSLGDPARAITGERIAGRTTLIGMQTLVTA